MRCSIKTIVIAFCLTLAASLPTFAQQRNVSEKNYVAYLFTYFTGNHINEESVHYAVSMDGYDYRALNNNQPVIDSKMISSTGGVRDPHILRCEDGKNFYMVLTDMVSANGWASNRAMILLKSTDLVHWSHSVINMQKRYKGQEKLKRVWAPQTIFDPQAGKYLVYWSMLYEGGTDVIYYAYANQDFTDLEGDPQVLFIPQNKTSCIDGDIVYKDGVFHLFYKTEGNGNGIKVATTHSLTSGQWMEQPDYKQQTKEAVEGAGTFKLIGQNKYILMYDVYMKGKYQFTESTDLRNFKAIDNEVTMNFHPRHGTIIPITRDELLRITRQWGNPFEAGGCSNNPILPGFHADPEILYSHQTQKYYIYSTTDGQPGWGGWYFTVFSSTDLKSWKNEGVMLDLKSEQVPWANGNAWAPCIEEKKMKGAYKYFFYYSGNPKQGNGKQIGVAVSDSPTGPFTDLGRPIITESPTGKGQQIDVDVFTDPVSGKSYLYWGNGYMAGAELNKDMLSVKKETIKVLTPQGGSLKDYAYREAPYVFYRNGLYYFTWSVDDTGSPNYHVAYGTSQSPLGPIEVAKDPVVLIQDAQQEIYGPAHNSILQVPGTDKWYIVYHRINKHHLKDAPGIHREVCIDPLVFNADGSIQPVRPSRGSQSLTVNGPDGKLQLTVSCSAAGKASYSVTYNGKQMLQSSPLGLETNAGNFSEQLKLIGHSTRQINTTYEQSRIKASHIHYQANELICSFMNQQDQKMDVTFRLSNNDVAFRYTLPRQGETGSIVVNREQTGFRLPIQSTTFLSPQSDAMIGWKRTKPSYEEEYKADAPMNVRSQYGQGYTFPALFKVGDDGWVLISETGVDSRYCGARLSDVSEGNLYHITFPMMEENNGNGTVAPAFALPGNTPWRTITVGETLKPIAETTVPWDVVEPLYNTIHNYQMGKGTWSWILWQDGSINYDDQIRYIDLAAAMGYEYVLIDNWWDTNIGHTQMEQLIKHAQAKGVDVFLWYSSSGYWNDIIQGPTNRMDHLITRKQEMKWMQQLGVKGIKVDFFGGDKQETMRLYESILSDADDHGLMVIFHGCTLPRGWERMYPNYVGSEAVLASENMVFNQHFCDQEAFNASLHPFIRNAVGSMEFGGCFLNKRLNKGNNGGTIRRTTDVFQLATTVLFQNPIQNFALAPNNLTDASSICLEFLKQVPTVWDETRLIDGYPGKYVVLARRNGERWYVAAINATTETLKLKIDLSFLEGKTVNCYTDHKQQVQLKQQTFKDNTNISITLAPQSGIVWVESY